MTNLLKNIPNWWHDNAFKLLVPNKDSLLFNNSIIDQNTKNKKIFVGNNQSPSMFKSSNYDIKNKNTNP